MLFKATKMSSTGAPIAEWQHPLQSVAATARVGAVSL